MKQFIVLSLDATDEFNDNDRATNLVNVDSEHDTLPAALRAYKASSFSNKYLAQVTIQEENI